MNTTVISPPRYVGPADNGRAMSPEEFDAIEDWDENFRYELVGGVVIASPAPSPQESGPSEQLSHLLMHYRAAPRSTLDATLYESDIDTGTNRRRADRAIWCGLGRTPDVKTDLPQIVVEFVSESRRDWERDYITKRDEYRAAGVVEYWVFDRFDRTLMVFHADGSETRVTESETYRTELMPGFELPLRTILAAADQFAE